MNNHRRNVTTCRGCGATLTEGNARRWQGRWVGACRPCEAAAARERMAAAQPWEARP